MTERNENSNYEPNFILQPAEPKKAPDAARPDDDDLMTYIFGEDAEQQILEGAEKAEAAEKAAEERKAALEAARKAATKSSGEEKAGTDARAAAERNVATEAKAAAETEAAAEAKAAAETVTDAEEPKSSPASDILRAAAARADALKAAAIKADQASEPYRRETSAIDGVEDRIHPGGGRFQDTAASAAAGAVAGAGFVMRDAEEAAPRREEPARNMSSDNGHPRFENPSFDPGKTGHYTDPRENFRPGASASWSNGEVHRSRRQMKDSIHRQEKQKKQKKPAQPIMMTRKAMALLIACCMLASCLFGLGGAALGTTLVKQNQASTAQTATTAVTPDSSQAASSAGYTLENATGAGMTIKEITAAAKNSVVEIRTESVASDTWMQQYVTEGAGSGVIISEDGYVMTNNHVIEGANKIKVTTADEKEYEATLVGTDENNDVAVLKIDASGLTPASYGNSDQLEVGDLAVAIGNPLGELGGTVTAGIISATDRELSIGGKTLHLLQTDSSINPGNSGGGLFSSEGKLIGLVVAKSAGSDVEGLGFAIPINKAADVAQQLIDKGYVSGQPSTGMTYQEGSSSAGSSPFDSFFGSGSASGVYIYSVNGENAKKAGFQPGDQVFAVDGTEISTFEELSSIVTAHKVGDKLTFTVVRDGVQKNIKLELEEKTAAQQNTQGDQGDQGQNDQDGQDQNGQNQQDPFGGDNGQLPDQNQGGTDGFGGWQEFFNGFF